MAVGSRQDQERVTVVLKGPTGEVLNLGVWQAFQGGAVEAQSTKNRQGGMGDEESLGGPKSRGSITVSRIFDFERDLPVFKKVDNWAGSAQVSLGRQKLKTDRTAFGNPLNYTGVLMKVIPPDSDSNGSEKAEWQLEIDADEAMN